MNLENTDKDIFNLINLELNRQKNKIELIASENFVSNAVLEAQGSILTNKYAEGYPGKRYYGGCEEVDKIESLAIERAKQLFLAEHANVQPHSGSSANLAVYSAVLKNGDTILGMDLSHGGHLTHGSKVNFSGICYNVVHYGVDKNEQKINYEEVLQLAKKHKPKLIVAGASSYSREIDFKKFREIADEVGAYLMADMAHIAGLVATGFHNSPVLYADFVTSTTHKTLRGPRGGLILCKNKYAKIIDKSIFPGTQGGPLMHIIAAKAVCFYEASKDEFKTYIQDVVKNAKALSEFLKEKGFKIISGGTDNHMLLVDLTNFDCTGIDIQNKLDEIGISCNRNTIPFDKASPFVTSGLRLGTPAITTRGFKEDDMKIIANIIFDCVTDSKSNSKLKNEVLNLLNKYPIY